MRDVPRGRLVGLMMTALWAAGCAGEPDSEGVTASDTSLADLSADDSGSVSAADTNTISDSGASDANTTDTPAASTDAADTNPTPTDTPLSPLKQCTHDAECDPANRCLGTGVCKKTASLWSCVLAPGSAVKCDPTANTPCQTSTCDPATGTCGPVAAPNGTVCSVSDPCVVQATCQAGACKAGDASWCQCATNADCAPLTNKNPCSGTWYCDATQFPHSCKLNSATAVQCDASKSTACTVNACDPDKGACALLPVKNGTPCDDADPQTIGETCIAGACKPGTKVFNCAEHADCNALEDGDVCNGVLFCDASDKLCKVNPNTLISCPSVNDTACNINTCDKQTGACNLVAAKNGTACDDGDPCTAGDLCLTAKCNAGKQFVCPCKVDADCASHDDGDLCNGTFFCHATSKSCAFNPTSQVICKSVDDTPCAKNACTPKTGVCSIIATADTITACDVPNGGGPNGCRIALKPPGVATQTNIACDDGDSCTGNDLCDGQTCKGHTKICFCQTNADCLADDDGDICNGIPFCDKSGATPTCKHNPASAVVCPKHLDTTCLANVCKKHSGECVLQPRNDAEVCDDGNPCAIGSTCAQGKCGGGQQKTCDDGNGCTVDACSATGGCVHSAKECGDGNGCTADACDPKTGVCTFSTKPAQGKTCNGDNNGCTVNDTCDAGVCKIGPKVVCTATVGPCEALTCGSTGANNHQCVAAAKSDGSPCDDGDPCIKGASCKGGKCAQGDKPRVFARQYNTLANVDFSAVGAFQAGTVYGGTYDAPVAGGQTARAYVLRVADETGFGWRLKTLAPKRSDGAGTVVGVAEISELVHALAMTDTDTSKDVRIIAWGGPVASGTTVWDQRLGGAADEVATAMIDHPGGGLMVANTLAKATTQTQIWRVSDTGNPQWTWTSQQADDAIVRGLTISPAGGGIIGAGSTLADVAGVERGWIVALSATGKLAWQRGYGSASGQRFRAVAALPSGGLVAVGETGTVADPRWWMVRLTADGGLLVQKVASVRSRLSAIAAHHDGLLVAAGTTWPTTTSTDGLLFGADAFGNIGWDRSIDVDTHDAIHAVSADFMGRIAAAGHTTGKGLVVATDPWGNVKCEASGACANTPVTKCDDGAACTKDVCTAASGCVSEAVVGTRCSDGDGCSSGGTCTTKGCTADANGRLHVRTAGISGLAAVGACAFAADDGLVTWARRTNGDVVVVRTDRLGALVADPVVVAMSASSIAGGRTLGDGGSVVVYTTTDRKVIARRVDASGKTLWAKTLAAATVNLPCTCAEQYCKTEAPHINFDSVRAVQVVDAAASGHVLAVVEQGTARTCNGTKIGGFSTYRSALVGCSVLVDVSLADGTFKERSRLCRGYQKHVSYNSGNPYSEFTHPHPVHPRGAVAAVDGSIVVAGHRRLTKMVGACGGPNYDCTSTPTGALAGWVTKVSSDGKVQWADALMADDKSSRFAAIAATSNGGFMAVGTALDNTDQSRLWLVQLGSGGSTLWQRFLPADIGAYNVRQVVVAPGDDLLIAGSRTQGGTEKLWLNRRTREGLELWDRAYDLDGGAVVPAAFPMLRSQDGRLFLAGTTTVDGTTRALFIRADPWGAPTCEASGACGQKAESACSDNKADTWDRCAPVKTTEAAERCQNKPLPCLPRKACEAAATHVKLGCTYAEDTCDDSNACTLDTCDPKKGTPTGGGCVHKPLDPATDCDDGKPCTLDKCDTKAGCVHPDAPTGLGCQTGPCHDGTCKQGICDAKLVATRIGCAKSSAAASCKAILLNDTDRPSGVYWLDTDGSKPADPGHRALCDMELDGGGWTLLLKSSGDCTLHYYSHYWSKHDLLNEADTTIEANNAKFMAYNYMKIGELRAVWPTLGGMRTIQTLPKTVFPALEWFGQSTPLHVQAPANAHHASWPKVNTYSKYGLCVKACNTAKASLRVKWGWMSPSNRKCATGVALSGIGMTCSGGVSAGWYVVQTTGAHAYGVAQPALIWGR